MLERLRNHAWTVRGQEQMLIFGECRILETVQVQWPVIRHLLVRAGKAADGCGGDCLGSAAQALLLGRAQAVRRGTAADELRGWREAPFVDAVLAQRRSRPLLRQAARLLRCGPLSIPATQTPAGLSHHRSTPRHDAATVLCLLEVATDGECWLSEPHV